MRNLCILTAGVLCSMIGGCALLSGPDGARDKGIVALGNQSGSVSTLSADAGVTPAESDELPVSDMDLPVLEAPDTVRAGVPFEVVVRTYGLEGCWTQDGAAVDSVGMTVRITPYDYDPVNQGCFQNVIRLPRSLELVFPEPGQGIIRVDGRKILGGIEGGNRDEPLAVEQQVVVR